MEDQTRDTDKTAVGELLDVLRCHGVKEIVCSPGSRNTPLIIAADARRELKKTVVVDERSAAFIALGKAMVSRKPVAIVCTSGTAMLNYAPALAEAYYQGVPLIAVTADRPLEWIDQDDSQTIRQQDAFANFVKGSYDITNGREDTDFLWYVNRIANEGMLLALDGKQGPVHFNVRLDNPLGSTRPRDTDTPHRKISLLRADSPSREAIGELAERCYGKKILIVAGYMPPDSRMNRAVAMLGRLPGVAVMAETVSNLHLPADCYMVDSMLCHLSNSEKAALAPDILITSGGAVVSRMLKEWIRQNPPEEHWALNHSEILADCYKALTLRIDAPEGRFLKQLHGALQKCGKRRASLKDDSPENQTAENYQALMAALRMKAKSANLEFLNSAPWSDITAQRMILGALPADSNLVLSNGTAVRYAQILTTEPPHASYCNRGVSGIDGSTSTAFGAMSVYSGMTVLVTGDMSFAYDIGALGSRVADGRMRVIVINNGGGGIFRFIGTTTSLPQREAYFCADPRTPVKEISEAYGWRYSKAENEVELKNELKEFFNESDAPRILEVKTPPETSGEMIRRFLQIKK